MNHPNASVAAATGTGGALLVYLLHRYVKVDIQPWQAGLISTWAASVFLFVGKRGLKNTLLAAWHGTETPKKKK